MKVLRVKNLCFVAIVALLLVVVAVPSAFGQVWEDHQSCQGAHITHQPYDSGYQGSPPVVQESVILTTKYRTNMTESPYTWTINYTENHGHSWNVTGEVEASIKSGMLTKVIADGCVKVGVGGEYSGSDNYEWQVTDQLSLGYCKRYKFECFIDTVSTECWRQLADYTWVCPVHYPGVEYGHNLRTCDGSANGQKNEDGGFEHISNYEQPNPCLDCYTGYHD